MAGQFQVILHAGVVDARLHPRLTGEIRRIYTSIFDTAETHVIVEITEIPSGWFFTAAQPSCSSLVGGTVPAGTTRADRTRLMSEISAMWCATTGCTANEIVISISDEGT
jgi:hypothetical protein